MATIKHRAHFKSTSEKVFRAITTKNGLESWWTSDVEVNADGKGFIFGFNDHSVLLKMAILEEIPNKLVVWKCTGELEEWTGTEVRFEISEDDNGIVELDFTHANWQSDEGDFPKCNTDWGHLMYFLKDHAEGKNDVPFMG